MKKKKVYSSDLKLQIIKEYLNSEKPLKDFSDEYSIPINTLSHYGFKSTKSLIMMILCLIPKKEELSL